MVNAPLTLFGDWMEAVKSAGLAPLGPSWRSAQAIKWSREEIVQAVKESSGASK